jgi:hypothetical protein
MKVYVNSITGIDDAIVTMFLSKHTLTRELEEHIRNICSRVLDRDGHYVETCDAEDFAEFNDWLLKLTKWGKTHITMLRFIDISCTVYGLHRAGQDDWDAHAYRFNNRIIRNSSRFAGIKDQSFLQNMSDYYADKVLTTDAVLNLLDIEMPKTIEHDGKTYVRGFNGYIVEGMENNQDVKRGLYNLGFPSDFTFKVNLTEFAHVYKERNANGGANPEVKQCCEMIADEIEKIQPLFNRELFLAIKN